MGVILMFILLIGPDRERERESVWKRKCVRECVRERVCVREKERVCMCA